MKQPTKTVIRSAYSEPVRVSHQKCGKSMTEQHHRKACDINAIIAKYNKTGLVDHIKKHEGTYGDVSRADFENHMNVVAEQKSAFQELPSSVRRQFNDDPGEYLDLMQTDEGLQTLAGMLDPELPWAEKNPEPDSKPEPEPEKAPEPE